MPKVTNVLRQAETGDVWSRISEVPTFDKTISACVYGHSASGKTTFWSTFPPPILAIICSGAFRKADELRSIGERRRKGISCVTLKSSREVAELAVRQNETNRFSTVVLDHLGGLQQLVIKEVLKIPDIPIVNSFSMADQSTWGVISGHLISTLRLLLDLNCNVVIVAQEREFKSGDADGSWSSIIRPYVGPDTVPSVATWLRPACNYGLQTYIRIVGKKIQYCLRTGPHDVYWSKFRSANKIQQDCIVDPTYGKLMDLIDGKQEETKGKTIVGIN